MKFLLSLFLLMGIFSFLFGQDFSAFEKRIYLDTSGDTLPYRILYPKKYNPAKKYPFVLFLHGAGERGEENEKQLTHGAKLFLNKKNRRKYPAIVVFPQCKTDDYWAHMILQEKEGVRYRHFPVESDPKPSLKRTMELLEQLLQTENVDPNRVYIAGLSMGGMGTYEMLSRLPNRFEAASAICGGGEPSLTVRYAATTSLWIFHGAKDDVVLPEHSRQMYEALKKAGAAVRYTEYPNANHNSWDPAFAEKDLLAWLFSHSLKK